MSSKFSLMSVVADQYGTLVDAKTGRPRPEDFFVVLALPLVALAVSLLAGWQVGVVSELIAAVSITTGLLFGLVVFLFQLRVQIGAAERTERVPPAAVRLVDEMFRNVAYAIVVGFVLTGVTIVGAATRVDPPGSAPLEGMGEGMTAVVLALVTHFLLVLAMCLKRLTSAYSLVAAR